MSASRQPGLNKRFVDHRIRACTVAVAMRTTNPTNGQTGNSRLAGIIRSRERAQQRGRTLEALTLQRFDKTLPCTITLTRQAPSNGLDDDGLRPALKAVRDATADYLGLPSDRDPRVTWEYAQRRGPYAVEIHHAPLAVQP